MDETGCVRIFKPARAQIVSHLGHTAVWPERIRFGILIMLLQSTVRGLPTLFRHRRIPRRPMQLFKSALRPGSSVVERGPEKAGVGGSIPSLATTF
jgi:hypothetical protein